MEPAFYRPWSKGAYEVSPNLRPFGTDFGNGELDQKAFQFDREWFRYFESKKRSLEEDPSKYVARKDLPPEVEESVVALMLDRLVSEWPDLVILDGSQLRHCPSGATADCTLGGLCSLIQEDVAIVVKRGGRDWIGYVNVCNPSHWLPTEKIGLSFFDAHTPIPGFERVNAAAGAMVDSMIGRGPFVRFVWGLESDDQLNHHPIAPAGMDQSKWYGRRFHEGLFVRVERQVLWPLPSVSAALFLIRPIVYPAALVRADEASWSKLIDAVHSMSPDAKNYKGLPEDIATYLVS